MARKTFTKKQRIRIYKKAYELFEQLLKNNNTLFSRGISHFMSDAVFKLYPDKSYFKAGVWDDPILNPFEFPELYSFQQKRFGTSYWWPVGEVAPRRRVFKELVQGKSKEDQS